MGRKTDAKDACVIADQAQMRLQPCLDVVWALVRDQRTRLVGVTLWREG
ncbi:hypothetical protein ACIGBH_37020 [Streptomyces sp. NPDC085929]